MRYIIIALALLMLAGCDSGEDTASETEEGQEEEASLQLRNIEVTVENGHALLTAQANGDAEEIYYTLEQGEEVLIEETSLSLGEGHYGWSDVELELKLPENAGDSGEAPVITVYGKNEAGEQVNPNYIPVEME
ncbi:hypothetical protein [Lentibacillus sediminis]|uniref:hypothetical protein n=1 Tax=Lentibacillus sediminis TaxID=1940529 RepID=UPI000C1BE1ED|nr:hypothetical protein [Lentibacillus sediminis]